MYLPARHVWWITGKIGKATETHRGMPLSTRRAFVQTWIGDMKWTRTTCRSVLPSWPWILARFLVYFSCACHLVVGSPILVCIYSRNKWKLWKKDNWFVVGNIFDFPYIGNNSSNWLIFFKWLETTNQINMPSLIWGWLISSIKAVNLGVIIGFTTFHPKYAIMHLFIYTVVSTLCQFNVAMENAPCIVILPIKHDNFP